MRACRAVPVLFVAACSAAGGSGADVGGGDAAAVLEESAQEATSPAAVTGGVRRHAHHNSARHPGSSPKSLSLPRHCGTLASHGVRRVAVIGDSVARFIGIATMEHLAGDNLSFCDPPLSAFNASRFNDTTTAA
eukprot:gene5252-biopygen798